MAKTYAEDANCDESACNWRTIGYAYTRAEHKRITGAAWRHMAATGHVVHVTLLRIYRPNAKRKSPYRAAGRT